MTPAEVRSHLLAALKADLVGPFALGTRGGSSGDAHASTEVLEMPPSRWYFTGFLAPQTRRAPEKDDLESHGGDFAAGAEPQADDADTADPEPARPIRFPASMGLSVYLPREPAGGPDSIDVELTYADYDPVPIAEDTEDKKKVRLALHYEPGFRWRPNRRGEDAASDDDPRVLALL
jgi:hypothetical protein